MKLIIRNVFLAGVIIGVPLIVIGAVVSDPRIKTLTWSLPTSRMDGSILKSSEIGKINVYYNGVVMWPSLPGTATSLVLNACTYGTYTVTAVDTGGLESQQSSPITIDLTKVAGCSKTPPQAPSGLTVINS